MVIDSLKLKSKIALKGMTYETLAEKINMTKTAIFFVVKKGDTKVSTLYKICKVLDCKIDDVLRDYE